MGSREGTSVMVGGNRGEEPRKVGWRLARQASKYTSGFYLGLKFLGGSLSITVNDCMPRKIYT